MDLWAGSAEEPGILKRHAQGCVGPSRGLEDSNLPLSARLVCSALLHFRSSWKVNSRNYFALCAFSEGLHSPSSRQQGFLCGI
jgi:hypothetical protein